MALSAIWDFYRCMVFWLFLFYHSLLLISEMGTFIFRCIFVSALMLATIEGRKNVNQKMSNSITQKDNTPKVCINNVAQLKNAFTDEVKTCMREQPSPSNIQRFGSWSMDIPLSQLIQSICKQYNLGMDCTLLLHANPNDSIFFSVNLS